MSTKYKQPSNVPTDVLLKRLNELANAVTKGKTHIDREFYMRIPAECDNDADIVIQEAAIRLNKLKDLCKEASDYLDINQHTNIGHNSILHEKFKEASLL